MLTVTAPAKLNLTLEALEKRPDGYHEIRSVVQTVNLHDKISFKASRGIEFKCNLPHWLPEQSLVTKAVDLLRQRTDKGAVIEIEKRLPMTAGLGGDSSDAAAVLRGLNMLWELGISLRELNVLGAQLSSDVALFMYGGTILIEGRGEKVTPLASMPHMTAVILAPNRSGVERKTERMYSLLKKTDFTSGQATDSMVAWLAGRRETPLPGLYNVFDNIALTFFNGLEGHKRIFLEAGAAEVHVAGSGPALFALCTDAAEAESICGELGEKGLESYVVDF